MLQYDPEALRVERRQRRRVKKWARRVFLFIVWGAALYYVVGLKQETHLRLYIIVSILVAVWMLIGRSSTRPSGEDAAAPSSPHGGRRVDIGWGQGSAAAHRPRNDDGRCDVDGDAEARRRNTALVAIAEQACFRRQRHLIFDRDYVDMLRRTALKNHATCPCGSKQRFGTCCASLQDELRRVLGKPFPAATS